MIAYLDCPMGIAGDMAAGALIDLGFPIEEIAARVKALGLPIEIAAERVTRAGIAGTKYVVRAEPEHEHRGLAEIRALLAKIDLPPRAQALATDVFERIARVEAKTHGVAVDSVHFHEVGAADSIADVVAFALAWAGLGIERAWVSSLPWTNGHVDAAHGALPLPSPASVALLEGYAFEPSPVKAELVTPTGAAIVAAVATPGPAPAFTLRKQGFGAGTKDFPERPNLTRVLLAELESPVRVERGADGGVARSTRTEGDEAVAALLEANIDDMTPELLGALVETLRGAGALDVWSTPVQMKKHRPGVVISVLAGEGDVESLATVIFRESTSIGLRITRVERRVLAREIVTVETEFGPIRVKVARLGGEIVNSAPEFEDVRAAAETHGVPLKVVMGKVRT